MHNWGNTSTENKSETWWVRTLASGEGHERELEENKKGGITQTVQVVKISPQKSQEEGEIYLTQCLIRIKY